MSTTKKVAKKHTRKAVKLKDGILELTTFDLSKIEVALRLQKESAFDADDHGAVLYWKRTHDKILVLMNRKKA